MTMKKIFLEDDIELTNPVTLTVASGGSPMTAAVGLLAWLEECGAQINDPTWEFRAHAVLLESGVTVEFESVMLTISCSHENVLFTHIAGEKNDFWGLCKLFCETEG